MFTIIKKIFSKKNKNFIPLDILIRFPSIIIEKYSKKKFTKKELNKYILKIEKYTKKTLIRIQIKYNKNKSIAQIFCDGSKTILLYYEHTPISLVSFNIKRKIIFIKQIQSPIYLNNKNELIRDNFEIKNFEWKKTMVEICEEYGKNLKCKEIIIQSAKNNEYLPEKSHKRYVEIERRFYTIYDKTAIALSYKMNKDLNYSKKL